MDKNIYTVKDKDEIVMTGRQLKKWKQLIIKDYKDTEYVKTKWRRGRRQGFLEAIECISQFIINESRLDPEPCCHGIKPLSILTKIEELKLSKDKRFVLEQKHLGFIKSMLKQGYSKNQIAKELKVSSATITYWTNPRYRKKQMEKNAKRRFGKKLKPIDMDSKYQHMDTSILKSKVAFANMGESE